MKVLDSKTTFESSSKSTEVRKPLPCGLKTPRRSFVFPILHALSQLGGTAPIREVEALVQEQMRSVLRAVDYEVLTQGTSRAEPRWMNTLRWAKTAMVKLDLLYNDSPRGIWELSDYGYEVLKALR